MNDLRKTPYTDRIMESTGADHREALVLETALRWGFGNDHGDNPGTLDHLGAAEFDGQVRTVFHVFLMDPAERDEIEKLAEAEHRIPAAPKPDCAAAAGDRVRVWFSGNGVVVDGPDDPKTRPYRVRLDGADADTFHNADQIRSEIDGAMPGRPSEGGRRSFPSVEAGADDDGRRRERHADPRPRLHGERRPLRRRRPTRSRSGVRRLRPVPPGRMNEVRGEGGKLRLAANVNVGLREPAGRDAPGGATI